METIDRIIGVAEQTNRVPLDLATRKMIAKLCWLFFTEGANRYPHSRVAFADLQAGEEAIDNFYKNLKDEQRDRQEWPDKDAQSTSH